MTENKHKKHHKHKSGSRVRKNGLAFLKVVLKQSLATTFGQHLISTLTAVHLTPALLQERSSHTSRTSTTNDIAFDMTIPASLCRTGHTHGSKSSPETESLATSSILAIFDELSTLGLMYHDKNHRPGVSVHLSTELIANIQANQAVYIHSHTDKIGKMLAFCTIEIFNEERTEVLARGKHIKYMPMGSLWDFFTMAWILPLFLFLYQAINGKTWSKVSINHLFTSKDSGENKKKDESQVVKTKKELDEVGSMFKGMNIVPVVNPATELEHILADQEVDPNEDTRHFYRFKVRPDLKNGGGGLHGGAIACIIEECCSLARKEIFQQNEVLPSIAIQRLDIRYLSPGKGEMIVKVVEDKHLGTLSLPASPSSNSSPPLFRQSSGCLLNSKGQVCVEFVCEWNLC